MSTTFREQILSILDGKSPDRVPWIPRLLLWYNARLAEGNMPDRFKGMTLREVERAMGCGTPARDGKILRSYYKGLEVRQTEQGGEILKEYVTPVGTVSERTIQTEDLTEYAGSGLPKEFPIKGAEDYAVMEYIVEHTFYEPAYEEYLAYEKQVGDDGYPLVSLGDCPFHHFLLRLVGYNNAYFELMDHLPQAEHLFKVMEQVEMERMWPVVLDSPARLFLHGVHFDSQMTPPHLFDRYIKPYYQRITPALHARGKKLSYHADDDSKMILGLVKESGFDMGESYATAPMVTVTLEETRQAWGRDVIVWGGVPSVILEEASMSEEDFESYMRGVFKAIAPGDAFILGVADNVMPRSKIERIERISKMVEEWGKYPIEV